jgi:Uncharacterized alpha/beta hydrolase domain (DUF2235)
MRDLIVCCDGTWMDIAAHSNVSRLHGAIVTPPGDPQPLYVKGVGVSLNPVRALSGGLTGAGLTAAITDGYRWLVQNFRPGDRISVFGFSRGAYAARSLAGMVGRVGLVDGTGLDRRQIDEAVQRAYRRYRSLGTVPVEEHWSAGLTFAYRAGDPDIPVVLVGVWDTVGALGIPAYLGIPDVLGTRERYEFLDVVLNPHIRHGRQAVSIDEMRGPFRPTLWRNIAPGQDVQQVWFPGDHEDVGGGHLDKGVSDVALDWMMREATATIGLQFDRDRIPGFSPDPAGNLHGMRGGALGAAIEVAMEPRPRAVPRIDASAPEPDVDQSAYDRQRDTGYRATRTLATVGEATRIAVPAEAAWTNTGLYLEPGTYRFDATGTWRSAGSRTGPDGDTGARHLSGATYSRAVGAAENALRRLLHTPEADLVGARREPARPWMSLVGFVANERSDAAGRIDAPDDVIPIGSGATARVDRPGYLYAFPNDAWGFYGNNSGVVDLMVTRL